MEKFQNKQFISFKLQIVLSIMVKIPTIPLCPSLVMNPDFLLRVHAVYVPHPPVT